MSNPYIELVKAHDALLQKQDAPFSVLSMA